MEVAALCLLLLLDTLESAGVSPNVSPSRSQFFKYEPLSVRCEGGEQQEEENWRVVKRTEDGEVRPCPPPCSVTAAFPATDSGVYWCETGLGETSNTVNITVTAGPVILESPVLPVMEGHDVTLLCRVLSSSSNLTASFYKDGLFIWTSSTRNMTIHSVSASDGGLYKCNVCGVGDSPESWLTVRAPPAGQDPPPPSLSLTMVLRHLMVGTPYLLSTVLLGLIYRDRKRAQHISKPRQTSDDVIMQIVI
ncbi:low affinity immunoglobulin gamma Fc region receptor II-a-like isoform X2 [Mastacembelus armatus]|uniref:low affinity immunoglobulin gamma Fc region receptor II-a-like isoform X2 n=1 Tax=Mastacembelus armatus TaxID=205130 RepID=UPI000E45FB21|nr:low affinity immunoglobulin gamma Fc region receptor II-a-like isoform X2 [Mastacembelus armatus]